MTYATKEKAYIAQLELELRKVSIERDQTKDALKLNHDLALALHKRVELLQEQLHQYKHYSRTLYYLSAGMECLDKD